MPLESSSCCQGSNTTGSVEIASTSQGGVKIPIKSTINTTGINPLEVTSSLAGTASISNSKEATALDSDFSHILPPPPSHASFTPSQVTSGQGEVEVSEQSEEELPEMETFEVELVKDHQGLGITIAGYVCEKGKWMFLTTFLTELIHCNKLHFSFSLTRIFFLSHFFIYFSSFFL